MQKFKFKEGKGLYRLYLTHAEAELIAAFVMQTRLGSDDIYRDAAFNLAEAFDSDPDFEIASIEESIRFGVSIEDFFGNPVAEFGPDLSIILEVTEQND